MTADVPLRPVSQRPTDWVRMIGWLWFAHGLLLMIGAPCLVAAHGFSSSSDFWNEMWAEAGHPEIAAPVARALQWTSDHAWFIGVLGLISSLFGLLAALRRSWARWPLHTLAGLHLIAIPWATWQLHQVLALTGAQAFIVGVQELIGAISSCICLGLAVVVVERSLRTKKPA